MAFSYASRSSYKDHEQSGHECLLASLANMPHNMVSCLRFGELGHPLPVFSEAAGLAPILEAGFSIQLQPAI